jgi:hypothetical protein
MSLLSRLAVQAARAYGILSSKSTNVSASYLVVAGGGGGSRGGGGAGGYRTGTSTLSTLTTYTITVGAAGVGDVTASAVGAVGGNSVFDSITSTGGGGGGSDGANPSAGGSGGGAATSAFPTGGAASPAGQGNAGGNGFGSSTTRGGGGGGGATAAGVAGTSATGGAGGAGTASSITGSSVTYAGGGGAWGVTTKGAGGAGGGGGATAGTGDSGTVNTGGGGGGGGSAGGNGGSGVVIISYTSATPKFVGGTLTTSGGNQIHTFTSSGTLSPLTPVTASYLVVAGGGGAGTGAGGGAGGLLTSSTTLYSGATYVVTVGGGGAGTVYTGFPSNATQGSNSVLSGTGLTTLTSIGGGFGSSGSGGNGGSGGGATNGSAGTGTSGQGNNGGTSTYASPYYGAGGGGGAGAVGGNGTSTVAGNGGNGSASSISGSSVTYAGGGGGGIGLTGTAGTGGTGGGGAGNNGTGSGLGTAGTTNTGGGGGGGGEVAGVGGARSGGAGGSGIVIISYAGSQVFNGGLVTSSGGNTIHTFNATGALTPLTNNLTNSLRFRRSVAGFLSRTPASATNRKTWTWSGWVKRGLLSYNYSVLFEASDGSGNNEAVIQFAATNTLSITSYIGAYQLQLSTTQVFRDPSAWYHIVVALDTTQATAANRCKVYINGSQVTAFSIATYPSQNYDGYINTTQNHYVGYERTTSESFDGYMTDINFIDGQALEPYYFGNNDANGVWKPILYKGTYGTNGFYLTFSDTSALTTSSNVGLGKDFSGNGNYWATNNISITAGTTYDAMLDVPTNTSATVGNYCVFSPLWTGSPTLSNGNLQITSATTSQTAIGSMAANSGKFYFEYQYTSSPATNGGGGVWDINSAFSAGGVPDSGTGARYVPTNGNIFKFINGSSTTVGTYATYTSGDIIGVGFDCDAGTVSFYKNNTLQVTITDSNFISKFFAPCMYVYTGNVAANFGQRPFAYTPPTGFVALNTFNLPTPTILQGNKYMDATLYTGNGSTQVIVNQALFKPDLVWQKSRSNAVSNILNDSVRGVSRSLYSNLINAEAFYSGYNVTAFNSNGFTVGDDSAGNYGSNGNAQTYVGWQWQAGQGSTSSNTSGSITSTVSVNATAGFSIVTYTGTGTTGTVGHGLGAAPKMIILKARNQSDSWLVYHSGLPTPATNTIILESTGAVQTSSLNWNSTNPTSTVFSVYNPGSGGYSNGNGYTYVAYCFAAIAGFSAFGSYTGNGSADGVFVYTGFRPRWVLIKHTNTAGNNWRLVDTSRLGYNADNYPLFPSLSDAESATVVCDLLSNGIKFRSTAQGVNGSGDSYIYAAFAENPFKNANAR